MLEQVVGEAQRVFEDFCFEFLSLGDVVRDLEELFEFFEAVDVVVLRGEAGVVRVLRLLRVFLRRRR